ncbi:MAG: NAD(P)/FAD-dependent oxidoreductase, partial [Pseudomonadales bacterium]
MKQNPNLTLTPYWHRVFDSAPQTLRPEQLASHYDVLVVGSGFTGLSAALTLARTGKSVLVADSGPLAGGASSRNGGLLGPSFHKLGLKGMQSAFGSETANALLAESLAGFEWLLDFIVREQIDCDLQRCGRFRGALKPEHFREISAHAESLAAALDYPVEIVSREQQH